MPKKIRVYELARELGLTNKETVDLAVDLGIGVKSHSSSIEDAQADRVRRPHRLLLLLVVRPREHRVRRHALRRAILHVGPCRPSRPSLTLASRSLRPRAVPR